MTRTNWRNGSKIDNTCNSIGGITMTRIIQTITTGAIVGLLTFGITTDAKADECNPDLTAKTKAACIDPCNTCAGKMKIACQKPCDSKGDTAPIKTGGNTPRPKATDTDGDGITDRKDQCPTEPEDFDQFEDQDGCPDLDNDQDGVPDLSDGPPDAEGFGQCRDQKETPNGYQDEDGCPDKADDQEACTLGGDPDLTKIRNCEERKFMYLVLTALYGNPNAPDSGLIARMSHIEGWGDDDWKHYVSWGLIVLTGLVLGVQGSRNGRQQKELDQLRLRNQRLENDLRGSNERADQNQRQLEVLRASYEAAATQGQSGGLDDLLSGPDQQ